MKALYKFAFGILALVSILQLAQAQPQQPLTAVSISRIAVTDGATYTGSSVNESFGAYNSEIQITATATGGSAPFAFQILINGTLVTTASASNTGVATWTPPQPGDYFISATVSDGTGTTATSLPVRYFATGTAILGPVANTLVPNGSSVLIQAAATPPPNAPNAFVKRVEFYADNVLLGSDTTYPYSWIYRPDPALVPPQTHTIQARAFDNNENPILPNPTVNIITVTPTATPPTVSISSPANTAKIPIGGGITVSVDAHSSEGFIRKVELYIDGVLFGTITNFPYTFTWHPTVVATYKLTAIAYDDKNNAIASTSDAAQIIQPVPTTVQVAPPPTVVLTSPNNGATVIGGSPTQLTATATANGGAAVTSVQFFVDDTFVNQAEIPAPGTNSYTVTATLTPKINPDTGQSMPSGIKAIATNADGFSTTSPVVSVTVTSGGSPPSSGGGTVIGNPPSVVVTSPTAGTQLTVNTATLIVANATDTDGNIASVQFFVNNTTVGTSTVYPYSTQWTPTSLGTYAITARATDNDGNVVTSSAVQVAVVDPTPNSPTISVTSPVSGSILPVNAEQTLRVSVSDVGSIAGVQYFVNGQPVGPLLTTFPFTTTWLPISPGNYIITARAINASGNQTTSAPVTVAVTGGTAPSIALASPGTNIVFGATADLAATASPGPGTTIRDVQFFANGVPIGSPDATFPYGVAWTPPAPGSHVLTAVATDTFGNQTTSAPVTVTVSPASATAPFVFLTSTPTNTNVAINTPVVLSASAGDPDGSVVSVGFFVNGQLVDTAATDPYFTLWVPSSPGTFVVTAVATDNAGNRTTSAASTLTATAQVGSVPRTALKFNDPKVDAATSAETPSDADPFKPVLVNYGSKLLLSADAVDQDGTIASVQFFVNGTSIGTVTSAPHLLVFPLTTLSDVVITALVTDSSGNSVYTNPIFIDTRPSLFAGSSEVTLVSPVSGSSYVVGRQIVFSATHNFGNVIPPKIDFYLNGSIFSTVTSGSGGASSDPYQTILGITRPGTYVVHAVGRSGDTTTVSAPATITVTGNNLPTISITSPVSGGTLVVGNSQTIAATAADSDGTVRNVQFFVNGELLSTDTTAPFTATWNPGVGGTYILTAAATDDAGGQTLSAPVTVVVSNNLPPTVAITGPASGGSISSGTQISLTANAADADGRVTSVRFLANGVVVGAASTAPFTVSWAPTAAGTYTVVAQATDDSGNVTSSAPITVSVSANQVPTVALVAPGNGTVVRVGSGLTLTATAADPDGTVSNVQFFANGTAIGAADATPPYTAQFIPTSEGIYRLTAVALDNAGATTTSSSITVLAVMTGGGDVVYSGTYVGAGEAGRFAMINVRGLSGTFIGFSTSGPARIHFFPGLTLDAGGRFSSTDASGRVEITGTVSDTGVQGTLDAGRLTFIGPATVFGATGAVAAGYYNGNLTDRPNSRIAAIVGPDASITAFVSDGAAFRDVGAGSVSSTGSFTITTQGGNRLSGTVDPATGFLSGSLSGGPGGSFTAGVSSGASFSDGFLRNLSTRGQVGTGANLLIAGFVVGGNSPKQVLIRAIGPSLTSFGIAGALADTALEIYNGNVRIASNDNWGGDSAILSASTQAGAFPILPSSFDSALLLTLAPGAYTAQVSGVGGRTGVALVELYDMDNLSPFSTQKVMNVATRGMVGTGQAQLIAGFVITGNTSKKVLIRAVGPALAAAPFSVSGALADPVLRLVRSDNLVVRENDNWEMGNDVSLLLDAAAKVGAFPLPAGSRDAAILINLPPGTYSAHVSGQGTSTGVALVEVYEVP